MSHTKEPWSFSPAENGLEWGVEAGKWGVAICADAPGDGTSEANARRIVACVNACAGIPTDDLERCPSGGLFHLADMANEVVKQRDELLAALEDAMIMIGRIKKHCQITDNAGYTLDGRMLKLTDVEQSSSAAIANTRKAMGKCYYAPDGTLMNSDGTRSIFDDVDQ